MRHLRVTPAFRISLGLVLLTTTILLCVDMLGILPDSNKAVLDLRKKTCESLAVFASLAVEKDDFNSIQKTLDVLKQRNGDIVSAGLRRNSGTVLAEAGDHDSNWGKFDNELSTPTNVRVPILKGEKRWGTFEVCFKPPHPNMVMSLWEKSIVKLMVIVIPVSFLGFYLLIKKTLRHLDPTTVVPERVKVALDSLVEGVVLMDDQERIVMVNKSFENKMGGFGEPLVGQKASTLNWTDPRSRKQVKDYPWQQAMSSRVCRSSVAMSLNDQEGDIRTFMVNGAPMLDGSGKTRGALATFDDITTLEEQNTQLQQTLNALKRSRDAVHKQNRVLQILATKDPLTNCLNRRAFFERFEAEFSRAERHKHDLSCVMVDIDHFKSINDNHGHPFGDKVLAEDERDSSRLPERQ